MNQIKILFREIAGVVAIVCMLPQVGIGQLSAERDVLASWGGQLEGTSLQVCQTGGEMMIQTLLGGAFTVTQGFQQITNKTTGLDHNELLSILDMKTYPNPVQDVLHISWTSDEVLELSFLLTDLMGKTIDIPIASARASGSQERNIDLSKLSAGSYFLQMLDEQGILRHRSMFLKQ